MCRPTACANSKHPILISTPKHLISSFGQLYGLQRAHIHISLHPWRSILTIRRMWWPFSPVYPERRPEDVDSHSYDYVIVGGRLIIS
jgi:hypothetical protein